MNKLLVVLALVMAGSVYAEEVGVKVDKVDASQDTTISIQKGKSGVAKKVYKIVNGEQDISGDKDVTLKAAQINWKAECKEWKKEFREDNKDNRILVISCGRMQCSKEGVESECSSTGSYKIKTLIEE